MRREHLEVYRNWRDDLSASFPWAFGFSWRSWRRHPFANGRHWWWTHVPHLPRWEVSESTVGAVDHESRVDADMVIVFDACRRCGVEENVRVFGGV